MGEQIKSVLLKQYCQDIQQYLFISPQQAKMAYYLGLNTLDKILYYFPEKYKNKKNIITLSNNLLKTVPSKTGKSSKTHQYWVNTQVVVLAIQQNKYARKAYVKVMIEDVQTQERGQLIVFGKRYMEKTLSPGTCLYLSGYFSWAKGQWSCSHFEYQKVGLSPDNPLFFQSLEPVYRLKKGVSAEQLKKLIIVCLENIPEILPACEPQQNWPEGIKVFFWSMHFPKDYQKWHQAREYFAYEEIFQFQYYVFQQLRHFQSGQKPELEPSYQESGGLVDQASWKFSKKLDFSLQEKIIENLPFCLTEDQKKVLDLLNEDRAKQQSILRLLEGDVGSGKTIVAFLAAAVVIEKGEQVAFMVPTELLAQQHYANAKKLLEPYGIVVGLLCGSMTGKAKKATLEAIEQGRIYFIIGTHSLLSEHVQFSYLSMVIIDEQHKFGVKQRSSLLSKAQKLDVLLLSATPIPRTLALNVFGYLPIAQIKNKPASRVPIENFLVNEQSLWKVYRFIGQQIQQGKQVYYVLPWISQQNDSSGQRQKLIQTAEEKYEYLKEKFPNLSIALLHSKKKSKEKQEIMEAFQQNKVSILVATSVIEVGIDVPNANTLVIEHAELFGLASLHQLRGRIGRSDEQAYCFFVYCLPVSEQARKRLQVVKHENDGFLIAQKDAELRQYGHLMGTDQSGGFHFKVAKITQDQHLFQEAKKQLDSMSQTAEGLKKLDYWGQWLNVDQEFDPRWLWS